MWILWLLRSHLSASFCPVIQKLYPHDLQWSFTFFLPTFHQALCPSFFNAILTIGNTSDLNLSDPSWNISHHPSSPTKKSISIPLLISPHANSYNKKSVRPVSDIKQQLNKITDTSSQDWHLFYIIYLEISFYTNACAINSVYSKKKKKVNKGHISMPFCEAWLSVEPH